ncbi:MAG TPA: hypothetical protein VNX21_08265, partial [Candidatus Thermoplasmatota archaeon]|nr:hypothetical protein [Candidatus Thermoplasmatota archaeon]
MSRILPAVALAACMLAVALPAGADHPQAGVAFDHVGGNEWWVEMRWSGEERGWLSAFVRDTGGEWRQMTRPSWSPDPRFFAASYHVEPGNKVQFKLLNPDEAVVSCWFTHPAGAEACDGTETGAGAFAATFSPSGHAELVRVAVGANRQVQSVHLSVMDPARGDAYGGELARNADGSWGRVAHVPDGLLLRFTAVGPGGWSETATSGCYRWPAVTLVECPPYPYGAWVENVHAGERPDEVRAEVSDWSAQAQVRFDGGPFVDMRQDADGWGYYHAFGAPTTGDHLAEFRVKAPDGRVRCDEDGYFWPRTAQHDAPMFGTDGAILFAEMRGDANWVQTNVYGGNVVAVEAQVGGGAWQRLDFQPWCDFAK